MAKPTFEDLKAEVVMKTEEAGSLPGSIAVGGVQYIVRLPVEAKLAIIGAIHNPAKLDDLLGQATFDGLDGSQVHA